MCQLKDRTLHFYCRLVGNGSLYEGLTVASVHRKILTLNLPMLHS